MKKRRKGHIMTKEIREKISKKLRGKKISEETKRKLSIANKGKPPKNKGIKTGFVSKTPKETRQKMSIAKIGNIPWNKGLQTGIKPWLGKKRPEISGKNHFNWKGGISYLPYSVDWNETLKRSIRERDKYTCQICKNQPETLYIHHIDYNKQNCNPDNLITLCPRCHSKTNFNRNYWINYFKIIPVFRSSR